MIAIEFNDLSMPEAEEVIVALWCCFEQHDIPSPSMTFKFYTGARASVEVHVGDAGLAKVLDRFLSNWKVRGHSPSAPEVAKTKSTRLASIGSSTLEVRH